MTLKQHSHPSVPFPFVRYDILCKAAYANLKWSAEPTAREWVNAVEASLAAVSKYGGAQAGYRTMLDPLIPACTKLKERLDAGDDAVAASSHLQKLLWLVQSRPKTRKHNLADLYIVHQSIWCQPLIQVPWLLLDGTALSPCHGETQVKL